jgi:hypothetical protein
LWPGTLQPSFCLAAARPQTSGRLIRLFNAILAPPENRRVVINRGSTETRGIPRLRQTKETAMCIFSPPSIPSPPPLPPAPPPPPRDVDPQIQKARDDERGRAKLAVGRSATILTGGEGLTAPASTTAKTLLGQ